MGIRAASSVLSRPASSSAVVIGSAPQPPPPMAAKKMSSWRHMHALGHARGAAGVEDVEVVGRARAPVPASGAGGQGLLVAVGRGVPVAAATGSGRGGRSRPRATSRCGSGRAAPPSSASATSWPQLPLVHEDLEVGVVDHVAELGCHVAVVEVDRHAAGLVAADHRLDPLGPVAGQDPTWAPVAEPEAGEVVGEPVGPGVESA